MLYILHAKACDNKTKKRAGSVFDKMTEMLKKVGSLGDTWGPSWDDSKADKLSSFALPCDQSKRMFNERSLPELGEVIDPACGGKEEDAHKMRLFMEKYVQTLTLLSLNREFIDGEIDRLGTTPTLPLPSQKPHLTTRSFPSFFLLFVPCVRNPQRRNIRIACHNAGWWHAGGDQLLSLPGGGAHHVAEQAAREPVEISKRGGGGF